MSRMRSISSPRSPSSWVTIPACASGARGYSSCCRARPRAQWLSSDLVKVDVENAIYFVSEITIVLGDDPGMRKWRKRLFLLLSRTSKSPVALFRSGEGRCRECDLFRLRDHHRPG